MPAIITTVRAALCLLVLTCAGLQWTGLRSHLAFAGHDALAEAAGRGRLEQGDAAWIAGRVPEAAPTGFAAPGVLRTLALLQLYQVDLIAAAKGIAPLQPSPDPGLTAARAAAAVRLTAALSRSPLDGDLWLRLGLLGERADAERSKIYFKLSLNVTPNEGWIAARRPAGYR